MAIPPGTRLGPYEVVSAIGAGGMGEVYQAQDTKLGRRVAIKVLPEAFAHDPDRLARFQREAKTLAALNHPNIATIHGLEETNGTHFLVMELVPGDTLADRIRREGAVPVEEALTIAKQIAEALEAAHEKGIIHRDLKPANVKVTPDGKVKVLDFGLAKAFAGDGGNEDVGNSPTLSMAATQQGIILGTAAYMSPEQAKGRPVTKATDIFAFGAVLFEMLSGKQAFQGEDVGDILAAVVRSEPDSSRLPEATPAAIRTLLRRCLRKDRRQRLQDATGVRIEIEDALSGAAPAEPVAAAGMRALSRQTLFLGLGALLLVVAITSLATWYLKPPPPQPVSRTVITLPPGGDLAGTGRPAVALSPDGSQLAYVADREGTRQLYLRNMDSLEVRAIAGTERADIPFFSPDGQWLGFFADGKLEKVPVSGGAAITLCDAPTPFGATWSSQGTIVFAPNPLGGLQEVPDVGGTPQTLTRIGEGEVSHTWPEFLPGGNAVLFVVDTIVNPRVAVYSLETGERRDLVGGLQPRYAPSGHLLYAQEGNLMAVPFDPDRLEVTGAAVPVVQGVTQTPLGGAWYSISATGSLIYVPGTELNARLSLVWVDRQGREEPVSAEPGSYSHPRISPDGSMVAVARLDSGNADVWIWHLARQTLTRLTFDTAPDDFPIWTPDGSRVVFSSNREGGGLFWKAASGTGAVERLMESPNGPRPYAWSADGELIYAEGPQGGISLLSVASERTVTPLLASVFDEQQPAISPDGRWMAYSSDESGAYQVYVRPFPDVDAGKWQVSTAASTAGGEPVWSPDGQELFYRGVSGLMAVPVETEPSFSTGTQELVFNDNYSGSGAGRWYDIAPDGQRFLMLKQSEEATSVRQIIVVQNWFEELKQRVPTGN